MSAVVEGRDYDTGRALLATQVSLDRHSYRTSEAAFHVTTNTTGYPIFIDKEVSERLASNTTSFSGSSAEPATPLTVAGLNLTLKKMTMNQIVERPNIDPFDPEPPGYKGLYWAEKILEMFPYCGISGHTNDLVKGADGGNVLDIMVGVKEKVRDYWGYEVRKTDLSTRTDKIDFRFLYAFPDGMNEDALKNHERKQYAYTAIGHKKERVLEIGHVVGFSLVEVIGVEEDETSKKRKFAYEKVEEMFESFNKPTHGTKSPSITTRKGPNGEPLYFQFVPTIMNHDRTILNNGHFVKVGMICSKKKILPGNVSRIHDDINAETASTHLVNLVV